jgi:hypothetical protein
MPASTVERLGVCSHPIPECFPHMDSTFRDVHVCEISDAPETFKRDYVTGAIQLRGPGDFHYPCDMASTN